jgi:hypothetical protein
MSRWHTHAMLGTSGAAPDGFFRCLLLPNAVGLQTPKPTLALDVSRDGIRLVDPSSDAPVASAWRAQVTATPALHRPGNYGADIPMPVLVVRAPGWQPLAIGSPGARSWRGEVPQEAAPGYVVSDADWSVLVDNFGLGPQLGSRRLRTDPSSGRRMVRGRERLGFDGWFIRIMFACLGLGVLYFGADTLYRYLIGTPTKVTVTHCGGTGRYRSCEGTWTINGVSQTGYIKSGLHVPGPGSSLDAHVLGGTAYTSTVASGPLFVGGVVTVGVVVSFVIRRDRPTRFEAQPAA